MRHAAAPKMRALRAYSTAQYTAADLDVGDYSKRVDTSLDALTAQLEELIETEDIDEIEQTRGQGGSLSDWDVEYAVRRATDPDWRAEPAHGHIWHLCDQQAAALAPDLALEPDEVGFFFFWVANKAARSASTTILTTTSGSPTKTGSSTFSTSCSIAS